eukprot:CAMPEP_0196587598 /NCGR_PEP_ID=MMETSP1081-20130531/57998_1 /TAXON_ID=36882 /ORGANISM="Pyramimonas amylifera, Strain CCMP720" /LENGTH=462 /DNA_ID=CAMNT_0041909823 /DNA_START=155 /DNA_END=1543 /DNA_ORIENTATION=-
MTLIYSIVGITVLNNVYKEVDYSEIAWVCLFSILWGFGGVGFGFTVKLIGLALGTSLVSAVGLVVGYILPAAVHHSDVSLRLALCTLAGCLLGLIGFSLSAKAGRLREIFLLEATQRSWVQDIINNCSQYSPSASGELPVSHNAGGDSSTDLPLHSRKVGLVPITSKYKAEATSHQVEVTVNPCYQIPTDVSLDDLDKNKQDPVCEVALSEFGQSDGHAEIPAQFPKMPLSRNGTLNNPQGWRSTLVQLSPLTRGILLSLVTGVLANMAQFVFVFGDQIVRASEAATQKKDGGSPARANIVGGLPAWEAAMPLWLILFTLGGLGHAGCSAYLLTSRDTWRCYHYATWRENLHSCAVCVMMATFFVAHIHLYGYAAAYLGESDNREGTPRSYETDSEAPEKERVLGAAIAWPMLVLVTVVTGQLWSISLGEWHGMTSLARRLNYMSMFTIASAVAIIAYSGTF